MTNIDLTITNSYFCVTAKHKNMSVSERIKAIRKVQKLSQQQVSERMGIDRAQYSRIETGRTEPTVSTLEKVASALGVEVADFFQKGLDYEASSYDSSILEKVKIVEQLDEDLRRSIFTFIDLAANNKKMKDVLNNALNIA